MRLSIGSLIVSALLLLVGATTGSASPASAAGPASSGLTLTVSPVPYFIVGQAGGIDPCGCGNDPEDDYSSVSAGLYLHATSKTSPITNYTVYEGTRGGPSEWSSSATSPNPLTWTADNYDGSEGCGQCIQTGWQVVVKDKAGKSVTGGDAYQFSIYRWNDWRYSSGWATSTCACADGGSMTKTSQAGAYGSFTDTAQHSGDHWGLMMATGPTRGRADIYLDGKLATTIDTYAGSNGNRIYVWDSGPLSKGAHTVMVVNDATGGRPSIYINAMGEFDGFENADCDGYCY